MGKSTVTAQLALAHQMMGLRVGVLDVDLCGPSIPRMLGLQGQEVHQSEAGWCPVFTDNSQTLGVMSIGFLLTNQVRGHHKLVSSKVKSNLRMMQLSGEVQRRMR